MVSAQPRANLPRCRTSNIKSSLTLIPPAMEEAVTHKRCLTLEPASECDNHKRCRTCCYEEDCELTTTILAQKSTIRNLTGVVKDLRGRIAALEGQSPDTISIDHTRPKFSKQHHCPVGNCLKAFGRIDHLHRHIRGVLDQQHLSISRVLDEKCCVPCNKKFKRPCDLVRHEKSSHNEMYISRAYKFTYLISPTPPYTSSNTSADLDGIGSE